MPAWAKANRSTRNTAPCRSAVAVLTLLVGLLTAAPADARIDNSKNRDNPTNVANPRTEDLAREVGIVEKVNSPIPMDIELIDEAGNAVELGSFFKEGRPVVINLGYSRCPSICIAMRNQLVDTLPDTDLILGADFVVLNVSIDPEETPEESLALKELTLDELADNGFETAAAWRGGWHFLTGDQDAITALTDAVGYRYMYIEPQNEYGHPGVLVLADGEGVVKRYLSGMAYSGRTLRLSIVETSQGKVGTLLDKAFVTCFVWDPDAGNYAATAKFIMMLGGGVTILFVAGLVLVGFAYEKRRRQLQGGTAPVMPNPA
ncbi:MAG: SCO family protein [Phycisphaeraceae bacterium]|nr:SCO family protein [Phycisphaeraceae bacterium]